MSSVPPNVIDDIADTLRTNYVGFVGFTILIWDHLDTFTTEVEYIWKGKKGLLVYLFLLNRTNTAGIYRQSSRLPIPNIHT
ncbi:hypothetical protein B0H17DRAFT_1215758 [Mycena rosella]|uniref:DUF6533 domain-containing protein n=1 Tax=Mycena rosella TaxID=1033263 RepID=A0AAD7CDD0_MYCRO|nr:hypothetical protein B0H17DRAFT_1215758 [Mycena rosella]